MKFPMKSQVPGDQIKAVINGKRLNFKVSAVPLACLVILTWRSMVPTPAKYSTHICDCCINTLCQNLYLTNTWVRTSELHNKTMSI